MTLVTTYLARTAQTASDRATVSAVFSPLRRFTTFVRLAAETIAEARELERVMRRKYPFIDV
jgi:hypothetical protein